ncbi:hypothetical protein HU200_006463 [Digitaria exilis]|uniref:Zinc finger GRF-type domain-containing protein n=1 Tax=Digitaria exilis TaxID=1010633 RepID=A0A835FR78_9POAL|nr:hypothetical protein HU200_006463 [Digitaria exilis]
MSTWRDDRNAIPPWNERPKCHCGFRTWLQVWDEPLPQGKKGCRFFECPDIDDDFKACTFMQWVDTRPLGAVRPIPEQVENKSQYYARLTQARRKHVLPGRNMSDEFGNNSERWPLRFRRNNSKLVRRISKGKKRNRSTATIFHD